MGKFKDIWESFEIKVPLWGRIVIGIILLMIIATAIILPITLHRNKPEEFQEIDENVYLYEETTFSDEIFVKCVGINVVQDENEKYILNLWVSIEQWNTDSNINQQKFSPDMFQLKLIDRNAPSKMSVFVTCLAQATLSAMLSGSIEGSINVLEETLGFAADYVVGSIENAVSKKESTIKAVSGQFEEFYPYENNGVSKIEKLSFELTDTFLNSSNTMVLSINAWNRAEKNIFLVLRPNMKDYSIDLDLNGGESDSLPLRINVSAGEIIELPKTNPTKPGSVFLCWTSTKDKIETKIRDFYFYTQDDNSVVTVYAYYQPQIPLDEFINLNEEASFKEGAITLVVKEYKYENQIIVKSKEKEDITFNAGKGKKYVGLDLVVSKNKTRNDHTLDNKDDFYLVDDYIGKSFKGYYGYSKFSKIKPIDDYTWIGLELDEIGVYEFTIYFEINENWLLDNKLLCLEIDFYLGKNAQSILLQ